MQTTRIPCPMTGGEPFQQVGALCLRDGASGPEVLLVTSLDTGRWVVPKGWPMDGKSLAGAALTEAWEEAGVQGLIDEAPVGAFDYDKHRKGGRLQACRVTVFRVVVEGLADDWPEAGRRRRQWFAPDTAAEQVAEPELAELLRAL